MQLTGGLPLRQATLPQAGQALKAFFKPAVAQAAHARLDRLLMNLGGDYSAQLIKIKFNEIKSLENGIEAPDLVEWQILLKK